MPEDRGTEEGVDVEDNLDVTRVLGTGDTMVVGVWEEGGEVALGEEDTGVEDPETEVAAGEEAEPEVDTGVEEPEELTDAVEFTDTVTLADGAEDAGTVEALVLVDRTERGDVSLATGEESEPVIPVRLHNICC